ncbi:MAG: HAD family hydrolase [Deltaproteobacteria bacterium]|jgi:phosphoglycolate phosphatase|nr:HAD family hydrolase [Deltaproteobacteria bacterium]
MYKAVIFDLDGTLLDTIFDLAQSMNNVLVRNGLPVHDIGKYKLMAGDGVESLVRRSLPQTMQADHTVTRFINEYRDEYNLNWNKNTRPYDGIIGLLETLSSKGLSLNVLSNKPHDSTVQCANELIPEIKFDIVRGLKTGEIPKPDPHGAIEISDMLRIPCSRFLYLGDTNTDMKTAVAAGMFPVGVLWGFRTKEELLESGAKLILEKPLDLLSFHIPDQ